MNLKYLVRTPKIEIQNPELILLIHGYGSNKEDLFSFAEDLPEGKLIVSIQAPIPLDFGGYAWYEINFMDTKKFNNVEQAKESQQKILHFIEDLSNKYTFKKDNIWLCGFSQGAILSYALILNHPKIFKKALCLSGYYDENIVGGIQTNNDLDSINIFASHGKEDTVIPIDWARRTPSFLNELKINYSFNEYVSGHGINPQNYRDMMIWIDENK